MYLPRIQTPYGPAYDEFMTEISHPYLDSIVNPFELYFDFPGDAKINGKTGYQRPTHFEYKTHHIVEPILNRYIMYQGKVPSAPNNIEEVNQQIKHRLQK